MFIEINDLPSFVTEGKITKKEAINYFCEFVYKNPAVFGLEKEPADLRHDLILDILEKGEKILDTYNPETGHFFSFFYATVKGRVKSLKRKLCRQNIHESCLFDEFLQTSVYDEIKYIGYEEIKAVDRTYTKAPFAVPRVKAEDIEEFFKKKKLSKEIKTLVILLFKYAFFIDYEQLKNICRQTKIDYNFLLEIKDCCMKYLEKKVEAQEKACENRNRTYFLRKKTCLHIQNLEKEITDSQSRNLLSYKLDNLQQKFSRQTERLKKDNSEIIKKSSHIVLQDKQIANFLGLCERQVRYYISRAKNQKINLLNISCCLESESE